MESHSLKLLADYKRPLCVNLDGVVAGKRTAKAAQKKVVVKLKPEEVIEISPDTKEEFKKDRLVNRKKTGEGSSRKKVQTHTSVLTARSKHACGVTGKPKEKITDIDAADTEEELAAVEYVEGIYKFYKMIESESQPHDYMDSQPEINDESNSGGLVDRSA